MASNDLRKQLEEIRDERRMAANTATRVGEALLALMNYASEGPYIRKDKADSTPFLLGLLAGATVGADAIKLMPDGTVECLGVKIGDCADFGVFQKGIAGGRIDSTGDGELRRLTLREELVVPKITYNSQEWIGGNTWRSQGGGVIEAVAIDIANVNYLKLSLLDGEGGKVKKDDKCQGIYHVKNSANETEDSDNHHGRFTFAGFSTVFFKITEVLKYNGDAASDVILNKLVDVFGSTIDVPEDVQDPIGYMRNVIRDGMDRNQYCTFVRRVDCEDRGTWTGTVYPQPHMNFAVYANENEADRQCVNLETPRYSVYLSGMKDWEYSTQNIQVVLGYLDGFNIDCTYWDAEKNDWVDGYQELKGEGIALGNFYMFGKGKQLYRHPTLISQQLHYNASTSESAPSYDDAGWDRMSGGVKITKASKDAPYLWGYYSYEWTEGVTKAGEEWKYNTRSDVFLISNWAKDGAAIDMKGSVLAYYASEEQFLAEMHDLPNGLYAVDGKDDGCPYLYLLPYTTDEESKIPTTSGDSYYNIADGAIYTAKDDGWQFVGSITVTTLKAVYSSKENPGPITPDNIGPDKDWHEDWQDGDIWMATSTDNGISWTSPFRCKAIDSVEVRLYTDNGNIIRNGEGSITISATVVKANEDITSKLEASAFVWRRNSGDATADAVWNSAHAGVKSVTVNNEDINGKALFECEVTL